MDRWRISKEFESLKKTSCYTGNLDYTLYQYYQRQMSQSVQSKTKIAHLCVKGDEEEELGAIDAPRMQAVGSQLEKALSSIADRIRTLITGSPRFVTLLTKVLQREAGEEELALGEIVAAGEESDLLVVRECKHFMQHVLTEKLTVSPCFQKS